MTGVLTKKKEIRTQRQTRTQGERRVKMEAVLPEPEAGRETQLGQTPPWRL